MSQIDMIVRRYVEDCTGDEVPELLLGTFPVPRSDRRTPTRSIVGAVAAAALVVAGVAVVREGMDPSTVPVSPASSTPSEATFEGDVAWGVLGTWTLRVGVTRRLESAVQITYLPDGTWLAWDGCNAVNGTYELSADGTLDSESRMTTLAGCPPDHQSGLPLDGRYLVKASSGSLSLSPVVPISDEPPLVAGFVLVRPGGDSAPVAELLERGQELQIVIETFGSSSCPYAPSDAELEGTNQLSVEQSVAYRACRADLVRSTSMTPVKASDIDVGAPLTVTLRGLFSGPITIPVDTSRLTGR